jgi:alkaline phosphatase D
LLYLFTLCLSACASDFPARPTVVLDDSIKFHKTKTSLEISFGSCYGIEDRRNDIFKTISSRSPDIWIWGGDATYVDKKAAIIMKDGEGYMPTDHVKRKYALAKNDYPHYNEMQANGTRVIGVWDDHDYGVNDGGN